MVIPSQKVKKELLELIGTVIVKMHHAESAMRQLIIELISTRDDRVGRILTADMHFDQLKNALMSLYRDKDHFRQDVQEMQRLLSELKGCEKVRNDLAHNVLFLFHGNRDITIHTGGKTRFETGLNNELRIRRITDIEQVSKKLDKLTNRLTAITVAWIKQKS